MMPRNLFLVRHGESESNAAKRAAEKGLRVDGEEDLMSVHTSERRLTKRGVKQARAAGTWLGTYFHEAGRTSNRGTFTFVKGFVSPYARAMETAGNFVELPIEWKVDPRLSERNWGELDQLPYEERMKKYGESMQFREEHGFFWPAANGETLQTLGTRVWTHFDMLNRDYSDYDVVQVSHGETIWVERFMLERWMPKYLAYMMIATDTKLAKEKLNREPDWQQKIINCRIIQYSRVDENDEEHEKYCRVRMIHAAHPDDPKWNLPWTPLEPKTFSSEELLEYVSQFRRYLVDQAA